MEIDLIQVLIQGGNVGISLALIILLSQIIRILTNCLSDLKDEISGLRQDIKDWRLFNNKK